MVTIDLAKMLNITQPAASQHIKVLKNVGILVPKRVKNRTYYVIDVKQLKEYKKILDRMFKMAFVKCNMDGDCENCPMVKDCG